MSELDSFFKSFIKLFIIIPIMKIHYIKIIVNVF